MANDVYEVRRAHLRAIADTVTRARLAEIVGASVAQLNHIIGKNPIRNPGEKLARSWEESLGLPRGSLDRDAKLTVSMFGQPAEALTVAREPSPAAIDASSLPLISWVAAGLRNDANDPYAPGAAEAWVRFDSRGSRSSYCLRVRGDSMVRPDGTGFPDGCFIAVDPARRPRGGDFVVVRFNDSDEATFKQYVVDGPSKLLRPLNTDFPTLMVTPDSQLAGVVFEKKLVESFYQEPPVEEA